MSRRDNPWWFEIHRLPQTEGAILEESLEVSPPTELGNEFLKPVSDELLHLQIHLTSLRDGILAEVLTRVRLQGQCVRCLSDITETLSVRASDMFFTDGAIRRLSEESDEEELREITEDGIDLESLFCDEVGSRIPFQPLCEPDCPGLCPQCGFEMRQDLDHGHEIIDSRWQSLQLLREQLGADRNSDEG